MTNEYQNIKLILGNIEIDTLILLWKSIFNTNDDGGVFTNQYQNIKLIQGNIEIDTLILLWKSIFNTNDDDGVFMLWLLHIEFSYYGI